MIVSTDTPQFRNDIAEVIRVFFPEAQVELAEPGAEYAQAAEGPDGSFLRHRVVERSGQAISVAEYQKRGMAAPSCYEWPIQEGDTPLLAKKYRKRAVKISVFRAIVAVEPVFAPWGSLTGIRPTKLVRELLAEGTEQQARELLHTFDVSDDKIDLALNIVGVQQAVLGTQRSDDMDVYIGIPFCRTRCSYCSFAAYEMGKGCAKGTGVEEYLAALKTELRAGAEAAKENGYRIRCLYVGGGTPTALTCDQLEDVLETALTAFGGAGREFTVEAGRPDTIDAHKFAMMKRMGVNRISINPQSMNEETLLRVGRSHSPADIAECFSLARSMGFDTINMDVIAGLPGETAQMVAHTLDSIARLSPDNLTVHTLAIKRSSRLRDDLPAANLPCAEEAEAMVALGARCAREMGMVPYYMYRQKYMRGNLENVGYCLPGKPSVYNIDIMEETTSILALGAGAISKWVYDGGKRIERAANPKDMKTYLNKIGEMNAVRADLMANKCLESMKSLEGLHDPVLY